MKVTYNNQQAFTFMSSHSFCSHCLRAYGEKRYVYLIAESYCPLFVLTVKVLSVCHFLELRGLPDCQRLFPWAYAHSRVALLWRKRGGKDSCSGRKMLTFSGMYPFIFLHFPLKSVMRYSPCWCGVKRGRWSRGSSLYCKSRLIENCEMSRVSWRSREQR